MSGGATHIASAASVSRRNWGRHIALRLPIWLILGLCCGLPLAWLLFQVVRHVGLAAQLHLDAFHWKLIARTIAYNAGAAGIATALAVPVAVVLGRGRGGATALLWMILPASLLIPSIVYSYGWSQLLRLMEIRLVPASGADVLRCVWALGAWLWPVPALAMGLSLRRLDPDVQQQAMLDGVLWRVTARLLLWPAMIGFAGAFVLALQEFAIYEPTGISVIATEVRLVFDTGMFGASQSLPTEWQNFHNPQAMRAAAAVITGLPLLVVIGIIALGAWLVPQTGEQLALDWPAVLRPSRWVWVAAWSVIATGIAVPVGALVASLSQYRGIAFIWAEFAPQAVGSLSIGLIAGLVALLLAAWACVTHARWGVLLAVLSFLVGGQLLAIALIRVYNRPWLSEVYDSPALAVMAYLARFSWIPLLAAATTWSRQWRSLREMAGLDGAGPLRVATAIVWPLAMPLLLASALLVMVLSVGEVPATALLSPIRPPMIVPSLLTWVHTSRYDPMIEASLLMVGLALIVSVLVMLLALLARRGWRMEDGGSNRRARALVYPLFSILLLPPSLACDRTPQPDDIWGTTGTGPAQLVYPRAISYSPSDDTFVVIDRMARVQRLDRAGGYINEWRMPKWEIGKPVGVSVSPDGDIYVPDTHYHRVQVYSAAGKLLREWGSEGSAPGQFIYPTDIAFDEQGRVFVSEYGDNDRIQVFTREGKFLYQFGRFGTGDGEFSRPQSMVIHDGLVYITDACNHRLVVFTTGGKFVRAMGGPGSGLGQFRFPYGLDIDASGRLIVCEFGNNRVQRVDRESGRGLATWGIAGHGEGELAYPWAVAVDKRGQVVVVDSGNNRLQVFDF